MSIVDGDNEYLYRQRKSYLKILLATLISLILLHSNTGMSGLNSVLIGQNLLVPEYELIPIDITVYNATRAQCDSRPDILADGTHINIAKAGSYRYCALSRNLLTRWGGKISYGDTIRVMGAEHLSGDWIVRDTMNDRFTNRIDLLVDKTTKWFSGSGQIMVAYKGE